MRGTRRYLGPVLALVLALGAGGSSLSAAGGGNPAAKGAGGEAAPQASGARGTAGSEAGSRVADLSGLAAMARAARPPAEPAGKAWPAEKRVRELPERRTANARFYQLSDGRVQAEISTGPVNYRDGSGRYQPIDTTVRPVHRQGVAAANTTNTFTSLFGDSTGRLVRFEQGGRAIDLALDGPNRTVTPRVDGSTVTYAGLAGGADLVYRVTPTALKEQIVLHGRPNGDVSYSFTLRTAGLTARQADDGSVEFVRPSGGEPAFVMPAPFMYDSRDDAKSPYGKAWSGKVTQRLEQHGATTTVTLTPDRTWLANPARRYPVTVDPTIKVQPVPADGQDVQIYSGATTTNFNGTYQLKVGTDSTDAYRTLVRFPLTGVPAGTTLDAARLELFYDQTHTTFAYDVAMEARAVTTSWSESTATWSNMSANIAPQPAGNSVRVDDGDAGTSVSGTWPFSTNTSLTPLAINGDYRFNNDATTGNTHTWTPTLTEAGDYQVEVHFVSESDRATDAPYTVFFKGGQQTYLVDQTGGAEGQWHTLGVHPFDAGTAGKVVLGDVANKAVIADAVRFTRWGVATKKAAISSVWSSFPVRNVVQDWLNGTMANNGFMVKAVDESPKGRGGPIFEASEFAYQNGGRDFNLPRLILTWGRPGVTLSPPTTVTATGALLDWTAYQDPSSSPADDIVEYQVHRSLRQNFVPSAATLVAPLPPGTLSYQDTSATPTPADTPDTELGNYYYYMVVVKTADGQLITSPTEGVRLPKAGHVTRIFRTGVVDTTLSQAQPDTNVDVYDGDPYVSPGNNSTFYGDTRGLVKFPTLTGIPADAQITAADLRMWATTVIPGTVGDVIDVHRLTRAFSETTATWNRASSTTAWTTPGGDYDPAPMDNHGGLTNDPEWQFWDVRPAVRQWLADPSSNFGLLLKMHDEVPQSVRVMLLSSEGSEPMLRPTLEVTYLEPTPASTYHAPFTPARMLPGDTQTVTVTVSNPTLTTWSTTDWELSYHWTLPDGTDVTTGGNQLATPLPKDIVPGDTVDVAAQLKSPIQSDSGNKRDEYVLRWELHNKTTGQWLSEVAGIAPLDQNVVVEDPTSDQIGLEKFYQYGGVSTGSGTTLRNNMYAGNTVWSYDAFTNPSRGVATFLRLAYNSQDSSDTTAGFGWSVQAASPTRLGAPLDFHPNPNPTTVTLTDGDGTRHQFSWDAATSQWQSPKGVHLFLQQLVDCDSRTEESRAWLMTRPDRTQFFFDCDGYISSVEDNNGNVLSFTYEVRRSQNKPTKFLRYITDPDARQTLTIDYWAKGDTYDFVDDTTWTKQQATNLTNPFIIDHVRRITDVSGRTLTFTYSDKGLLAEVVDGAGSTQPKVFAFRYDMTQGNKNVKLVRVTDPRGNATTLDYYSRPEDDPKFKWNTKTYTDRLGNPTAFAYSDPDGTAGSQIRTVLTDAENHSSTALMDGFGRPVELTDALNHLTRLGWDADNNVVRLEEANGAVFTWTYDPKTGYPTEITDAEANAHGWPGTRLTYQTLLDGHIADLISKTSQAGRTWTFTYTVEGDLATVTDPKGTSTPTAGDFTTTYTYDTFGQLLTATDANGHTTTYSDYDASGFPRTITDALDNATAFVYDARGQVTRVTDALGHHTTQSYDVFGRPLEKVEPKDEAAGVFITTPAPVYDANDNVTKVTDPNGAVHTAVYDADDRIVSMSEPKDTPTGPDRITAITYDRVGNILTQTSPNGTLTTTDPDDFVTRYTYDPLYRLTAIVNAAGGKVTYAYDDVGNMTTEVDANKNATADTTDYTAKYTYDLVGRTRTVTDAAGHTKSTDYDRDGLVVATTDEDGNKTLVTLDERGMTSQVQVPFRNDSGTIVHNTTKYTYDEVGNQTRVESPRGVATTGVTTDFVSETVYDELDRVKEQLTPFDPNDPQYNSPDRTIYSYDPVGRLTKVSAPPSAGQTVRNDTTYTYFDNGWTRTSTDPWDIVTSYDYNELGQQTSRTITSAGGSSSRTLTWTYYPDGKLKSRTDDGVPVGAQVVLVDNSDVQNVSAVGTWPSSTADAGFQGFDYQTHAAGTGSSTFTWSLVIPQDGTYEVFVRYPSGGSATNAPYTVTSSGGSTTRAVNQQANGGTWVSLGSFSFTADGPDQKVTLSDNANGTVAADAVKLVRDHSADVDNEKTDFSFSYDPDGNQTQVTDSSPGALVDTYAVTYDGLDQVSKVEEKLAGVVKHTTAFTYDANGNTVTRTHDAATATFEYDVRDLLAKVTNAESASDPKPKVTTYTYTVSGQVARETKPNGNTVDSTYFLDGALQHQVERKADGTLVAEHTYDYDPNGNQTSDVSKVQNADNHSAYIDRTTTSTYDPRDRLVSRTKKDASGATASSESYVYDANDNTIRQTAGGSTTTSTYNRNRLVTAVTDGIASAYDYDPFGRLDTVTTDGNLVARYTYDGFDRIASQKQKAGTGFTTTRFTYDPFDRTASQTTDAGGAREKTTVFQYLAVSNALAVETVGGKVTKTYQYTPWGERTAQIVHKDDGTEEPTYYSYNGHSDVDAVTDANGDTKSTYGYTAYGEQEDSEASGVDKQSPSDPTAEPYNSYRFNASRFDPASGNYDMGFRNYDPGLNRFLTRDLFNGALADMGLATDPYTNNRYTFGAGNPISSIELDGHFGWSDLGHMALDAAGMIPVVGAVADVANGVWYAAEGDWVDAGLSFAGAIPVIGDAAVGAKYAVKGAKYTAEAVEAGKDVVKAGRAAVKAEHAAADAAKTAKTAEHVTADAGRSADDIAAARRAAAARARAAEARAEKARAEAHAAERAESRADEIAEGASCPIPQAPNSFPAGTRVLMGDGTTKPIEQVRVGDWVEATDPATGRTVAEPVTDLIVTPTDRDFTDTVVLTPEGNRVTITSTQHHPFYDASRHDWVDAAKLQAGDELREPDGTVVTILSVRNYHRPRTAYNLTVASLHTYYVLAGGTPLLVHNARRHSIDECRVVDLTLGPGPYAKEGVALPGGNKDAPGVQDLTNEIGARHGCHTCGAKSPGTASGNWITDHQGATKLLEDSPFPVYQTGYPHCWSCARQQAGVVTQINKGHYDFPPM
jgi:RHS repeat-associated protein